MTALAQFPVDDQTLDVVLEALDSTLVGHDCEGEPVRPVGFGLHRVLEMYSGYNPELTDDAGDYPGQMFDLPDVVRALIVEVRRLRQNTP